MSKDYNFQVDFTYNKIIAKFAELIFANCHNLLLWSTVPEFAKSGYTKGFDLERTYPPKGTKYLNPGPQPTNTWTLSNGLTKLNMGTPEITADILNYSCADLNFNSNNTPDWENFKPYSENIIYFVSYLLSYCFSHLRFYRQIYEASYINIYPCTFLIYSKSSTPPTNYQLKILENTSNSAEVIHAITEVVKQEFNWEPQTILSGDYLEYGAYKTIFEKIKSHLNVENLNYTITWYPVNEK